MGQGCTDGRDRAMTHGAEAQVQDEGLPAPNVEMVQVEQHVTADVAEDDGVIGQDSVEETSPPLRRHG